MPRYKPRAFRRVWSNGRFTPSQLVCAPNAGTGNILFSHYWLRKMRQCLEGITWQSKSLKPGLVPMGYLYSAPKAGMRGTIRSLVILSNCAMMKGVINA